MLKFCSRKYLLSLITALIFAITAFVTVSCGTGGGSDYDDNPQSSTYNDADTLISIDELKSWVDNVFFASRNSLFLQKIFPYPGEEFFLLTSECFTRQLSP